MRRTFGFHGGIHPPQNKQQSLRTPIADAGIPPELILPLSQPIGAPASPVVTVGEHVRKGQLIATARDFVSVPVHASTSGTIHAIEERLVAHPSGYPAPCIVIATDGRDEWVEHSGTADYEALEQAELIQMIRDAGIAGMGGAGFPSAVKLSVTPDTPIATLIINGAECEPYITADDVLMRERAAQLIEGVKILRQLLAPTETLIGVEDNKPQSIAALRAAAQGTGIDVVAIPTRYPSGGENQLIESLTGKQVPSGELPSRIGVICQNIGTAVAIFDAVVQGRPLLSRVTTVTGDSVREPQNFRVLIGTPMRYLLEKAGYQAESNNRLIVGGPLMGFTVPDAGVPIVKTTNCLLVPTAAELPTPPPAQACIRCGVCAEVCPASLLPQQLFWFAQGKEFEKLEDHNLFDCIECGACAYVCPSRIPLVQYYRSSMAEIRQLRRDQEQAMASRLRFEAHQQRLERTEAEKEARRSARKQAAAQRVPAAENQSEADPIQAAIARANARKAAQRADVATTSALNTLERAIVTTDTRLATATAKLDEAKARGSDLVEALQAGVEKTRAKLAAAQRALHDYQQSQRAEPANPAPHDATQAVLAKATAARALEAALSPADKARADLATLQQRLRQTQDSLARSRREGDAEKVIVALEASVVRLSEKISATQQYLNTLKET